MGISQSLIWVIQGESYQSWFRQVFSLLLFQLTYVGDNSFGETILSMHSKGDIMSTKEPVGM